MELVIEPVVKLESGETLRSDVYGNDVAIICPNCNASPVILVSVMNMRGACLSNPAICKVCGSMFSIVSCIKDKNLREIVVRID